MSPIYSKRIYLILRFRCYTSCDTTYRHKRFYLLMKCCVHEYICVLCSITFLYCHWTHNHSVLSALFLEKFLLWTFLKKSWHFHTFQFRLSDNGNWMRVDPKRICCWWWVENNIKLYVSFKCISGGSRDTLLPIYTKKCLVRTQIYVTQK